MPCQLRGSTMTHVQINGTDLFYRSVGTGWPCFILHGGLGLDHTYMHPWLDPLSDQLQLIYYDQRGNGRSGRSPLDTLTFEQFCADARRTVRGERVSARVRLA